MKQQHRDKCVRLVLFFSSFYFLWTCLRFSYFGFMSTTIFKHLHFSNIKIWWLNLQCLWGPSFLDCLAVFIRLFICWWNQKLQQMVLELGLFSQMTIFKVKSKPDEVLEGVLDETTGTKLRKKACYLRLGLFRQTLVWTGLLEIIWQCSYKH